MMHSTKTRGFVFGAALLAFASLLCTRPAHASADFPAALQKALEKRFPGTTFCVPLCTACHNTTAGGPENYNVFGKVLRDNGLGGDIPTLVDPVLNAVLNMNLDSDGDGKTDAQELAALSSPSLAEPRGVGEFCSDLTYGCGARIAAAPPPIDPIGLLSAGLVVLGLTVLRRQRRLRNTQ
ncbi:MAG: hypothetical protein ABW061_00075 [Polyangiaceae bacterium]